MSKRHTISINYDVYTRLKSQGEFGESFTDVISRLLNFAEGKYLKFKGNE
jgi:predicted CopG family antitoxin